MKELNKEDIVNKLNELQEEYDGETIRFFIEINDEHTYQLFQTISFDTPEDCLKWLDLYCIFLDCDLETWLMYEVEDSDIDRFADIKITKNGYKMFD